MMTVRNEIKAQIVRAGYTMNLYMAGFAFYSRHELEWHDFIAYGSSLV